MRAIRYTPAVTIVAAWISALTGVGPSIASGKPGVQRDLRRLGERADEQQQAAGDEVPLSAGVRSACGGGVKRAEEVERVRCA